MQSSGLLVTHWPVVLGCDAGGVVVEVGQGSSSSIKVGQRVAGCTRLGVPGYSTFQEFFLMDERLALQIPEEMSYQQAATLGVGTYTACLGLFQGLELGSPVTSSSQRSKGEWVVILGGAGSVGQYSVQIAKALGYNVVATCSTKTAALVKGHGADATIDYSQSEADQLQELQSITKGNFFGVWDAVARSEVLARRMLDEISTAAAGQKRFATTDDWTPMEKQHAGHSTYRAALGPIGRAEGQSQADHTLDDAIASYVLFLNQLLENGQLRPNESKVVSTGFEGMAEAIELQQKGAMGGVKVLVDLQSA